MTTITNKFGFPDPLYQAAKNSSYSAGDSDISVTTLIDAPRPAVLAARYADQATVDVSELMYSLIGQGVHTLLERSGVEGIVEERLYAEVDGWRISGQFDYIDKDGMLWDWKTVSVYEVMNGIKSSREQQLNCYAYLARKNGYDVKGLRVGFVFRDWRPAEARQQSNYPPHQALIYPITMWTDEEVERYITERVRIHKEARESLPECTDEEQWRRDDKWAVYRTEESTRASKLFDNESDAQRYAASVDGFVKLRRGVPTRCLNYCGVSNYCEQFQREHQQFTE